MKGMLHRPLTIGTSLIVILLVIGITVVLLRVGFRDEFQVNWPSILGILGITLYLAADELTRLWKPARWVIAVVLPGIAIAVSLLMEPQGVLTYHEYLLVLIVLSLFALLGKLPRLRDMQWPQPFDQ